MAASRKEIHASASAKVDRDKTYPLEEACKLVPETKVAKFDESVDIAVRLGVDPSTPTRWSAAPSCCRTAPARASA